MDLYVSSVSTGAIQRSPGFFFHSCDLRQTENLTFYLEEDREAIEFLTQRGIKFNLIDLSNCPLSFRLKAKIARINKTPTLVLDDGTKLKGVQRIKEYFQNRTK